MIPNNPMNTGGMDFNRYPGPQAPVAPANQPPFAGQNPNAMAIGMNGPAPGPFGPNPTNVVGGRQNNRNFSNNNRNYQPYNSGVPKRMRKY